MKLSIKITVLALFFTAFAKAQVGIGTQDPKAALDIRATANPQESGILIPKLAAFPTGVTADQDGMLVYIDGSLATSKGFYYYEEVTDTWIPIAGAAAADNQQIDVLNLNGTTLELSLQDDGQATQTLDLSSLQDGNTQNTLDGAYDEGGAGTGRIITADTGAVEIQGNGGLLVEDDITAGNAILHNGDADTFLQFTDNVIDLNAGGRNYLNINHANQELLINSSGATTDFRVRSDNETNMFFIDGSEDKIGIGTNNPLNPFHIGIRTTFDTNVANSGQDGIFIRGSGATGINEVGGSISFGGAHPTRDNSRRAAIGSMQTGIDEDNVGLSFFVHQGPINTAPMVEGMRLTHQRYLGINNNNPSATLDVVGSIQFEDGNEAAGKVLTSDATGNATWQTPLTATDTDDQQIDVLNLNGTNLEISLQDDGVATQTLNLAPLQDGTGTDDQNLTTPTLVGTTLNLNIENGTGTNIDLAPLQDGTGTDDQTIDNFNFNSGTGILTLELEDDGIAPQTVNLSSLAGSGGTDDQQIDVLSLNGTNLEISLEDDGVATQTLNLAPLQDGTGTDDQNLTTPTLVGTTLNLNIENGTGTNIDLAPLQDGTGTDDQTIDNFSLSGSTLRLSLEDDGQPLQTVNLAGIDTDNQQIDVLNLNGTNLEISLQDDGVATQTLNLASLQDGTGTDNQTIDNFSLSGSTLRLSLEDDAQPLQTVDLSSLTNSDNDWNIPGTTMTPTTINDDIYTLGKVNIGSSTTPTARLEVVSNFNTENETLKTTNSGYASSEVRAINNVFNSTAGSSSNLIGLHNDFNSRGNTLFTYGIYNDFDGSANSTNLIGAQTKFAGTQPGTSFRVGYNNQVLGGDVSTTGFRMTVNSQYSIDRTVTGVDISMGAFGTGRRFGTRNQISGTGTGDKYGLYNIIDSASPGIHYGVYSEATKADGYSGYFIGRMSLGTSDSAGRYLMPATDGTAGQVMTTDGAGNVTFQNASASGGTLDQAYDFSGAGNGNTINATDGAVSIAGEDGFIVTGTFGTGDAITTTGAGTRMFFNPRKAAFRAGFVDGAQWDDLNVGVYSSASGRNTIATGYAATAFGSGNSATGNGSSILGYNNLTSGIGASAIGQGNSAAGDFAVALGSSNNVNGRGSFASGESNNASASYSVAMGNNNDASGFGAMALGTYNTAASYFETTLGSFTTNYTPASTVSYNSNDRLLSLGNGISETNRSNALTIYKNGLMNINDEYNMPLTDGTSGQVMTTDGAGNVSFQNNMQESTTANNGLTLNTGTVQLGGVLTQNTVITQGTRSLDINLNSTGDFAIQDNGSDVFFVEDSGEIGIGTNVPVYPLHMVETGPYNNGFFMTKIETSSAETSGMRIEKQGLGTGRSHGLYTVISGSGTGQKYGVFNRLSATSNGNQYGTRNYHSGATASSQFATFNNLDNAGTGNRYGVYNGMRSANAANLYGVFNEFERNYSTATDIVGVRNRFTGGTPGAAGMNGIWTDFTSNANGNYYGTRTEFSAAATGTGNKYGTYNLISTTAGGTHYGIYNSVGVNDGWASYNLGKSYISQRLSIGETDNATARLSILNNSGGSNPAHIELRETGANDGARIRFSNNVETTNEWILFGLADNTTANSRFNLFHTSTGNVMVATGNGDVGFKGTPDVDHHIFHGNNGNADGMKLQNNSDNSWWRFYVSSGSDDLRLYSTSQGTTIIGAFNDITGAYTATSDRRLKENFKDLYFSWDQFLKLAPLTYAYKADQNKTSTIGMVAQDVKQIYPELVTYHDDEDIYHMDYSATGVIAIKAVQELKKEVDIIAKRNTQLMEENAALKAENNRLKELEKRIEALEQR
ncbi:MAG: tail fiber domain-containing protein [Nonlabens sp.]|uniref:tail fiber domain-containing protein n=1 Tax=Nonlabens sp. TaxID=1888209 RepID=UPI003EF1DCA3